jgi:hypothetical protein
MAATQARQKSYADKRRKPIEFEVGDHVYLKVSPMRGVKHFGIKRKLEPRYVGPYRIIEKSGRVAYKLTLLLTVLNHQFYMSTKSQKKG